MYTDKRFLLDIFSAMNGNLYFKWLRFLHRDLNGPPMIVLFPDNDRRYYDVFSMKMIEKKLHRKIIVLHRGGFLEHRRQLITVYKQIIISKELCDDLIKMFSYGVSTSDFLLMSISLPDERACCNLDGIKGITFERLVYEGIMIDAF